jgi:hypothetical protein
MVALKGSANTVAASVKESPCLRRFFAALRGVSSEIHSEEPPPIVEIPHGMPFSDASDHRVSTLPHFTQNAAQRSRLYAVLGGDRISILVAPAAQNC